MEDTQRAVPRQTILRLPEYVTYLKGADCEALEHVSAGRIASALGRSEIQVRKDLAAVSAMRGKPRIGFDRAQLLRDIERYLGFDNVDNAILAGVGNLGTALMHYDGFHKSGVKIVAAFDSDPARTGRIINGVHVLPAEDMPGLARRMNVHIGIIAVPAERGQAVADAMVGAGILAIWNFSPIKLHVPQNILVQNEDMANSLTMLSHHLAVRLKEET